MLVKHGPGSITFLSKHICCYKLAVGKLHFYETDLHEKFPLTGLK